MIKSLSNLILITLTVVCAWLVASIAGDSSGTVKASAANLTAYNTPYAYYDYERDPRQWFSSGYGSYGAALSPFNGGVEALVIGFMIALAIGFIGLPLMILLYSMFLGNTGGGGFSSFPSTTTINGRKRRDVLLDSLFPSIDRSMQNKFLEIFKQFTTAPDKMDYLVRLLKA